MQQESNTMDNTQVARLEEVKARHWFYEFNLPDGSRTKTDLPIDIQPIHASRRDKLRQIIRERIEQPQDLTAIDLGSHEGYYTIELRRHFKSVVGYEFRNASVEAARLITDVLDVRNVEYIESDLQTMVFNPRLTADF